MATMATMATTNGKTTSIPVIDISSSSPEAQIAERIVDAAATYGFVYIKNEGKAIPIEAIDQTFELSKKLFSSPIEEKETCKITENNRGWSGMHTESLDAKNQRIGDFKEAMNFGEFSHDGKAQQPLPPALKNCESELCDFQVYCNNLMLKILTLFAIGLKVDQKAGGRDWFSSRHRGGSSGCIMRLLHYPSIPPSADFQPKVDIRAGAHSDYGSITLLFQRPGQPGLEILPPGPNPIWTPVPVFPPGTESDLSPPILVNIGDLLSYWTNNYFKSTVHRVVFPKNVEAGKEGGEDRYSIAYFGHPVGSTVLEAVPSEIVSALKGSDGVGPEGKKAMTADEHLLGRLRASYLSLYRDDELKKDRA